MHSKLMHSIHPFSRVQRHPHLRRLRAVKRPKAKPDMTTSLTDRENTPSPESREQKEDLLIRDLWQNGIDSVHDIHVVNTYAKYHLAKPPEKWLQEVEREKKIMYLDPCLQQHRHLSSFVASVDRFLGMEVMETLKRIASCLATKWQQPYLTPINLVQATHQCIRGYRMPAHRIILQNPQWEYGARINIFR